MGQVLPDEFGAVSELTLQAYVLEGFVEPDDSYTEELADTRRRAREAEVWVAREDGRLLGAVTLCPLGSAYREIARDDELEFRMLAVSGEARGRGVGRALVELSVARARELGYAGVRMSSMDRMVTAHRLYERLGFVRVPEDDWEPVPDVRLLAYALTLDGTDEDSTGE